MLLAKWLDEFVHVDANDKDFAEAMTLSGSKVETHRGPGEPRSPTSWWARILSMERHPDSDHMWICQVDVGQGEPVQIVTGAWNIHPGDLVPVALDHSTLPGGKKIEKGKLRGVESNGMMCGLYELGLDERDFPYAAIVPAAILNDYHPLDKDKPSIPADIQPGDKVFGPVVCAKVLECASQPDYTFHTCLDLGGSTAVPDTICPNLHEGDLVAYNTKTGTICTLADLHADQKEFPHCIPDGIFVLHEEGIQHGDDIKPIIGADDHVVEFEITPNRPDCLSVIGLAREVAATYQQPLTLHEPEVQGGADGVLTDLLDVETPAADLVPRYTARMVRNVKIAPSPKWMRERLRSMGVRPINNIVDITNYVMLEYGQPMHAFDYRYVKGGKIIVRRAEEGEELTTLDGNVRKLTANHLVIADEHRAVGLAGIMGGRELRDRGGHHRRGVRVRLLRRHLHPQGRPVPGDADRGLRQVREGSGSPEHPARRPAGLRAGGAAGRRRGGGRRHRHPQLRAPAPHHPHGPGAGERACWAPTSPQRSSTGIWPGWTSAQRTTAAPAALPT